MLIKQKSPSLPRNLVLGTFVQSANGVLNKDRSPIPPLFNSPEVLSSASDKAKLFAKKLFQSYNLKNSGISLPVFPSRTNLKLNNIPATPTWLEKS